MLLWDITRLRQLRCVVWYSRCLCASLADLGVPFPRVPPSISLSPILRSLLVIIPTIVLSMTTDVSKMYHKVRGQDTIKLYVIYNALEVSRSCPGLLTQLTGLDRLQTSSARLLVKISWIHCSPRKLWRPLGGVTLRIYRIASASGGEREKGRHRFSFSCWVWLMSVSSLPLPGR